MPLKRNLTDIPRLLAATVRSFPLPVISCLIAYACILVLIADLGEPLQSEAIRVLMACSLALPLWFALAMRRAAKPSPTQFLPELIGLILIAAYGWWLLALPVDFPFRWGAQFAILLLAIHCFVACAPVLRSGNPLFWDYNKHLFLRWLLGVLYAVVLFAGLALAMFSVVQLLSFEISGENYARLFFGIVTIFHPLFFLAGAPQTLTASPGYPAGLRRFVQFCCMPLVGLYGIILYLYTAKILIAWELPNGWVALPVLVFAVVGILSALLLDPLRLDHQQAWAGRFTQWFYRLLLPLAILLMISIGVRIADHGMTEKRYIVAVLAGWLFTVAAGYGWGGLRSMRWIPLSLGMLCLPVAFGPGSASALSAGSQSARVLAAFTKLNILHENRFVARSQTISSETYDDLRSRIDYLFEWHGDHFFDAQMAGFAEWGENPAFDRYNGRSTELLRLIGLRVVNRNSHTQLQYEAALPLSIESGQLSLCEFWNPGTREITTDGSLKLEWRAAGITVLHHGTQEISLDWRPLLAELKNGDTTLPASRLTQRAELTEYSITLTLLSFSLNTGGDNRAAIYHPTILVLVRTRG